MNKYSKRWLLAAVILAAAVTLSCSLVTRPLPQLFKPGPSAGLIAYLGTDGNIYTIDREGENLAAVTDDANILPGDREVGRIYQYPTWAPDSRRLAFIGLSSSTPTNAEATLYTASPDGKDRLAAFTSRDFFPFYLYWSPDSANITFLSNDPVGVGLALLLVAADGSRDQLIGVGQPYYWDWSPDGQVIVTHTGGTAALNPRARMVFHQMDGSGNHTELELKPGSFQAPAWSPDGKELVVASINEAGVSELVLAGPDGAAKRVLAEAGGQVAFAWSPDGKKLAYATSGLGTMPGLYTSLVLTDPGGPEDGDPAVQGTLLGFFWSPDSQKIAYFLPDLDDADGISQGGPRLSMQVHIYDLASGENRRLAAFEPTTGFLQVLPYFDQYNRSGTIWSPDSTHLVLSAVDQNGDSRIITISVADGKLNSIAEGEVAFWSWK